MIKRLRHKSKVFEVITFVLLLVAIDFTIGEILRVLYFRQDHGFLSRITHSIEKTRAQGLIFGSSRASHHYISDSLSTSLKMPFDNVGQDGQSIFFSYALFKGVTSRYAPRVVILDILSDELNFKQESYDRLSELLPYYRSHKEFASILHLRGPFERLKLSSGIYPFNSLFLTIGLGNSPFGAQKQDVHNGFEPLVGTYNGELKNDCGDSRTNLDSNKINVYRSFIRECKDRNIQLFIVVSPLLSKSKETQSTNMAKQIASEAGISFLNFSGDRLFVDNAELFWDPGHLNVEGAKIFTKVIYDTILKSKTDSEIPNQVTYARQD